MPSRHKTGQLDDTHLLNVMLLLASTYTVPTMGAPAAACRPSAARAHNSSSDRMCEARVLLMLRRMWRRPFVRLFSVAADAPPLRVASNVDSVRSTGVSDDAADAANVRVVDVSTFDDVRPWLKQFVRRVHPDVVFAHSDAVRRTNNESLLLLNSLMDGLEARCQRCTTASSGTGALPPLRDVYRLKFNWEAARVIAARSDADAPSSLRSLRSFEHAVRVPTTLEAQTRVVVDRAASSQSLAREWLRFVADSVNALLQRVSVPATMRVAAASARGGKARPRLFAGAAARKPKIDLLRENLVQWSPLQQGKIRAFPGLPAADNPASVFSAKQRKQRVSSLYQRGNIAADKELPSGVADAALARLTRLMLQRFDRYLLYHDAWFGIHVHVCRVYMCVPDTRRLLIPVQFDDEEVDAFICEHVPRIVADAVADVPRRMQQQSKS